MKRSKWKNPYIKFEKKIKLGGKKKMSRNSLILPAFTGKTFHIHNGKAFFPVSVNEDMVGHKFGEFVFTRQRYVFKKKKLKKKRGKKK